MFFNAKEVDRLKFEISKLNTQLNDERSYSQRLSVTNDSLKSKVDEIDSIKFKYDVIKRLLDDDELILSVFDSDLVSAILEDLDKKIDPRSSKSHFYWAVNQQAANLMKIYKGGKNE